MALPTIPTGTITIEVIPAAHTGIAPVSRSLECNASNSCSRLIQFGALRVEDFTVRITTTNGSTETVFEDLAYQRQQPNGRNCEPICWHASVAVGLPGAHPTRAEPT